ncbi:MAG: heme exporter protein C [Bacteroidetes bacterium]|nr:MAG: heme exporter protein C [Bacteroidota bacterium]
MKNYWWKILCAGLLFYTLVAGFITPVPRLDILNESIRNLYFHVPMWFAMMALLTVSLVASIRYLGGYKSRFDQVALQAANVSMLLGVLGLLTGMLWANFTWGKPWTNDPKLNGVAIGMLTYLAYFVLRGSIEDPAKRARISAVYNIFAYVMFMVFINVLPRLTASLHPGNGGNPGFDTYDLDSDMRLVFYPAVFGWILLGVWLMSQRVRLARISEKLSETN